MNGWFPAVIGLAGVALGTFLAGWLRLVESRLGDQSEWRARAAQALGPAQMLLTDANPTRVGVNFDPVQTPLNMEEFWKRSTEVRRALGELRFGYPSEPVRKLARKLDVAIYNALVSTSWVVADLVRNSGVGRVQTAKQDHAEAEQLLEELGNALHAASPRRRWPLWRRRDNVEPNAAT